MCMACVMPAIRRGFTTLDGPLILVCLRPEPTRAEMLRMANRPVPEQVHGLALIDTGALITGFSNEAVARYLLSAGLGHVDACVFLDQADRKMIYVRGAPSAVPLQVRARLGNRSNG